MDNQGMQVFARHSSQRRLRPEGAFGFNKSVSTKKAVPGVDDIKIYCERREAARGYASRHNRCGL
jgi:hypothetical protein